MTSINTRADLNALAGTPAHAAFMVALGGTLYRLQKDDAAKTWTAVLDTSAIERFGFTLDDFAGVSAPTLPEYVVPPVLVPTAISMRQARLALAAAGLLDAVNAAVAAAPQAVQIEWEYATSIERQWATLVALQSALGLSDAQLDALFVAAAGL